MRGVEWLLPSNIAQMRALRLAFGLALFAALFMVLSASGAFAASGSSDPNAADATTSNQPSMKSNGLLSGIISPVVTALDTTAARVPVVGKIKDPETVRAVVAPVTSTTGRVETAVNNTPVAGAALAPVGQLTSAVVPPVVNTVEAVMTPVLETVDSATAPVVGIVAPIADPVVETLKPIVDRVVVGVSSGSTTVVVTGLWTWRVGGSCSLLIFRGFDGQNDC